MTKNLSFKKICHWEKHFLVSVPAEGPKIISISKVSVTVQRSSVNLKILQ